MSWLYAVDMLFVLCQYTVCMIVCVKDEKTLAVRGTFTHQERLNLTTSRGCPVDRQ